METKKKTKKKTNEKTEKVDYRLRRYMIIDFIVNNGPKLVKDIMAEFHISRATFFRDKKLLLQEGYPLEDYTQNRKKSGFYEGLRLKKSYFNSGLFTRPALMKRMIKHLQEGGRADEDFTPEERELIIGEMTRLNRAPEKIKRE